MASNEQVDDDAIARLSSSVTRRGADRSFTGALRGSSHGAERRSSKREEDRFPVEVETEAGARLRAQTVNISKNGLALECDTEGAEASLGEGSRVKVVLTSPFLGAQAVQIVQEFQVLTSRQLVEGRVQLGLRSSSEGKRRDASASGFNPLEFVLPAEQENIFMQIQAQMSLQLSETNSKVLVFTGVDRGAGTSTISWWYAVCLARKSLRRVLFVDANVVAKHRGAEGEGPAGLVDLLLGKEPLEDTILQLSAGAPDLLNVGRVDRLTSSEISPSDVRKTFALLREHYDYIIVDAPPSAASSITMLWAQSADGCMLVLESGASERDAAQTTITQLRQAGASVLGAVLNKVA